MDWSLAFSSEKKYGGTFGGRFKADYFRFLSNLVASMPGGKECSHKNTKSKAAVTRSNF